ASSDSDTTHITQACAVLRYRAGATKIASNPYAMHSNPPMQVFAHAASLWSHANADIASHPPATKVTTRPSIARRGEPTAEKGTAKPPKSATSELSKIRPWRLGVLAVDPSRTN